MFSEPFVLIYVHVEMASMEYPMTWGSYIAQHTYLNWVTMYKMYNYTRGC